MSLRNLTAIGALLSSVLIFIGRPAAQVFTTPKGEAQNVRFEPGAAGVVTVTYDLIASDARAVFSVSLEASLDLGKTFPLRAGAVSGDVGTGVKPGPGKRIIWESAKDTERLDQAQLRFRIAAIGAPLAAIETAPPPPAAQPAAAAPAKKGGNGKMIGIIGGVGAAGAIAAVAAGGGGGGGGTTPIAGTGTSTTTTTVPAATPNRSPTFQGIAASPSDKVGIESATVFTFTATSASDPDGDALTYDWDFGDGTRGSGQSPTKTYSRSGVFEVRVTISDGRGGTAFAASGDLRITNMNGIWDLTITAPGRNLPLATRVTMTMSQSGSSLTGVWSWIDPCGRTRTQNAAGNIISPRDIFFGVEHWSGNEGGCTNDGVDTYLLGPLNANTFGFSGTASNTNGTFSATRR